MISRDSKATIFANGLAKLRTEPHFGAVKGVVNAFRPESALLLGSGERTASLLHENVQRLMAVDFEQARYDANLSNLSDKAEFYPKAFPVYDDNAITGSEGLDLSDLYSRIKGFFKESDLLVIDHIPAIALGAFNFFADHSDIIILRGIEPSMVFASQFKKYRMTMRYAEPSAVLVKNHIPVGLSDIRDVIYNDTRAFYQELGIEPAFKFAEA
jgi:hypothetical protein